MLICDISWEWEIKKSFLNKFGNSQYLCKIIKKGKVINNSIYREWFETNLIIIKFAIKY